VIVSASAALPSSSTPATITFVTGAVDANASTVVAGTGAIASGNGSAPIDVVPVDACGVRLGAGHTVTLSSTYGTLTPVVDDDGTYRATFRTAANECGDAPAVISAVVDDVPLSSTATVSVSCSSVGDAPVIDRSANGFGARERPYVYDDDRRISARGTPPLRYQLASGPEGVFVNEVTGRIDWFPLVAGRFTLEVVATNQAGEDRYAFDVDISPEPPPPPEVTVLALPPSGGAPLAVSFDGSQSTASTGASILVSRWEFGDGSGPSYAERTTHTYLRPGGYVARLQVADSLGGTAAGSAQIAVTDEGLVPPLARIVASATEGNDALEVTLACDCTAGSAPINAYVWDLGDGTTSTDAVVTHEFAPGAHEVRLVVTDENALSAIDRRQIVVLDDQHLPPEVFAQASPVAGEAPLTVTLTADAGDLDGQVGQVQWEFSDGQRLTGDVVERTFSTPGLYVATATVVDDAGLQASATVEVQVTGGGDVPPVIVSVASTTARVGEPWHYDADDVPAARGDRPLVWGLGKSVDGALFGVPPGATVDRPTGRVAWTPQTPGTYPVVLVVENAAGIAAQQFDVVVVGDGDGDGGGGGGGGGAGAGGCTCGAASAPVPLAALVLLALRRRRRPRVR
jgi:PKD repeat protein